MPSRIKCVRPRVVRTPHGRATVRCGNCRGCRIRHKMAWTGRVLLESKDHYFNRVLTLTYRDPEKQLSKLDYKDIQDWLKRYRYHTGNKVRYWVVGEYGEESGHAHWHVIMFGEKSWQPEHLKKAVPIPLVGWTKEHGFASDMRLVPASAAYCCGYTLKKGENQLPFMRCSLRPSIAFPRLHSYAQQIFQRYGSKVIPLPTWLVVDGKKYPLNDGAMRSFRDTYLRLGGLLPPDRTPLEREFDAYEYSCSDAYLGEKVQRKLDLDERNRLIVPAKSFKKAI